MTRPLLILCSKVLPVKKWRKAIRAKVKMQDPMLSFSQEGEDLILNRIFERQKTGFYVDVGAHHPFRFSNTSLLYRKRKGGWTGMNIDPLPGTKKLFDKYRPRDINLEVGVASCSGKLTYYMFNEPALNTFDLSVARCRDQGDYKLIETKDVPVLPLSEILKAHLPGNQSIDFLTIDAEGLDFEILKSNNWEKYAPRVVVIEVLACGRIEDVLVSPSVLFLKKYGYSVIAKTINSVFLEKHEFL